MKNALKLFRLILGFAVLVCATVAPRALAAGVPSSTTWVQYVLTTNPQTLPVIFVFAASTDLLVLDSRTSPPTTLVLNSDYTVTGGNGSTGSVVTISGGTNGVKVGDTITVTRRVPLTQLTTFNNSGVITPKMVGDAVDKLTEITQQLNLTGGLSLQFQKDETLNPVLPLTLRRSAFLAFDNLGRPWFPTTASIVTSAANPISASSIQALRSILITPVANGTPIEILGYYGAGDGGGGPIRYLSKGQAPGTYTDNGGSVVVPTGGDGSAAWLWDYSGPVNVRWFGAHGDGATDDAAVIDKVVAFLDNLGGGVCVIPRGTYLLGTLSSDPLANSSYICAKSKVSIVGEGIGASVLKVKSGQNAVYAAQSKPNIIGTSQATPLTGCRFADLTFDWNGANNLLTNIMTARANACIIANEGGIDVVCERLECKEIPGNNCIVFAATSDQGQVNVVVRDCVFKDCGSGLPGNYNTDHSSVYLNGTGNIIEGCQFTAGQKVQGACFELHGSDALAFGCKGENYYVSFYLVANFQASDNLTVRDSVFTDCWFAFAYSSSTYAVNNASILNCSFSMSSAATYSVGQAFGEASSTAAVCDKLTVTGCRFMGLSKANCRLFTWDRVRTVFFTHNYAENFVTDGVGPRGSNLGGGICCASATLSDNIFSECLEPIFWNTPIIAFGQLLVTGNSAAKAAATADIAIQVYATGGVGLITDNVVSATYTGGTGGIATTVTTLRVLNYGKTTWVPVVYGLTTAGTTTYSTPRKGQATKIGNRVFFDIHVVWTGQTGTGGVAIDLPTGLYAPLATADVTVTTPGVYTETIALDPAKELRALVVGAGSPPYIQLMEIATGAAGLLPMGVAGTVVISGSYVVAE